MTATPAHVRLAAGASIAFVVAFVSVATSDVDFDGQLTVMILLVTAVLRLITAASVPVAAATASPLAADAVSNRVRTGILLLGFVGFLLFSQTLRDRFDGTPAATVSLGLLYLVTTLFVTQRTQAVRVLWLAIAATVLAIGVGADSWWILPLAAACALAASGYAADSRLPTFGTENDPGSRRADRSTIAKALGFALVAALLALWWQPKPPSDGGGSPTEPDGPVPTTTILVPVEPAEPSSLLWLLLLLLLFLVLVIFALLLWWYLRRRRQPWPTRTLRRFTKAGSRLGVPIAASDTLPQFAGRFPEVVGDLPFRIANALDNTTYSDRSPSDIEARVEPELQSLERLAKAEQRQRRRTRIRRLLRRER